MRMRNPRAPLTKTWPHTLRSALVTLFAIASGTSANATDASSGIVVAHAGFGVVVDDERVAELAERNGVEIRALHVWVAGLTSAHRADVRMSARALLADARARTIEVLRKSLEGSRVRFRHFAQNHTEHELVTSTRLQNWARSLLNYRAKFETALAAVKAGQALVFAVDVWGSPAQLKRFATNDVVQVMEQHVGFCASTVAGHPDPFSYEVTYVHPDVASLGPAELYRRIIETAR
jgi:hypothetical protein